MGRSIETAQNFWMPYLKYNRGKSAGLLNSCGLKISFSFLFFLFFFDRNADVKLHIQRVFVNPVINVVAEPVIDPVSCL